MTTLPAAPLPTARSAAPRRRWPRLVAAALLLPLLAWASLVTALWFGQERLLFHPSPLAADVPLSTAPGVTERYVEVPGARLSVLELRQPEPRGVVFFLHGNAGNLKTWFIDGSLYRRTNFDLVMMDYRGFGKSSGRIESEAQLHADVEAVWQAVAERYRGKPVVAFGRSLGTGLAAAWAVKHQPAMTVLVSPYASLRELAALHYPWVPSAVLRYPLRSDEAVPQLRGPVMLVHGDRDRLIPPSHSETLARLARDARHVVIAGAAHDDVHRFEAYTRALTEALDALR